MTSTGNLTRFIASKTRVAPLRKQTIPRLELLSALLLSRLMVSVTRSLESILTLSQPTCYTDSKVALYWILGTSKEWKQFVQNRVAEIRGEAIMLVKLSIILFSNSHNFTYYAHRFYLLFSKLCLV